MHTLVLASQSPRRRDLLKKAGFEFEVASVEISEIPKENLSLRAQIEDLAQQKAQALVESPKLPKTPNILLLSADTVVVIDDQILNKPRDLSESESHIRLLSGRTHQVITGVCLWDLGADKKVVTHEIAEVTFRKLPDDEIHAYVQSRDGMDKAGAYGIQSMGATFISNLKGSLENVMGLPVALVERLIEENGWKINRRKS